MKGTTATFVGHRECYEISKMQIKENIIELIEKGVTIFLNGGMGAFDWKCAYAVNELKKEFPHIKSYLVIPYLTFNISDVTIFDDVIYPEGFEKYHFKSAIIKRNNYLVEHSSYAICYISHSWGGAFRTYKGAIRKGLTVINLYEESMF